MATFKLHFICEDELVYTLKKLCKLGKLIKWKERKAIVKKVSYNCSRMGKKNSCSWKVCNPYKTKIENNFNNIKGTEVIYVTAEIQ